MRDKYGYRRCPVHDIITDKSPCPRCIEVPPEVLNTCVWENDEDGIWHAACDHTNQNLYCFTDEGPEGNGFKFCPFCGRKLSEVKPESDMVG